MILWFPCSFKIFKQPTYELIQPNEKSSNPIFFNEFLTDERRQWRFFSITFQMYSPRMPNSKRSRRALTPGKNFSWLRRKWQMKCNKKQIYLEPTFERALFTISLFIQSIVASLLLTSFTDSASQSPSSFQGARLIRFQKNSTEFTFPFLNRANFNKLIEMTENDFFYSIQIF